MSCVSTELDELSLDTHPDALRCILDALPHPIFVKDGSHRLVMVNRAMCALIGRPYEELIGRTAHELLPEEQAKLADEADRLALESEGARESEEILSDRDAQGRVRSIGTHKQRAILADGARLVVGCISDITDRKRAQDELSRTREFLNAIIENVPVSLVVKDARDLRYVLVNRASEELWGISRDEVIGKTAHDLYSRETAAKVDGRDRQLVDAGRQLFFDDHTIDTPGRGKRPVTVKSVPILGKDQKPEYLVKIIEDITQRKLAEAKIAHLAHHDPLTDLPNRAAFSGHLAAAIERARASGEPFAVISIDLDRFKEVNDVFGHAAGDALLCEAARRLRSAARDAFVARLGGDEFMLVVAGGPQPTTATELVDRLLAVAVGDMTIEGTRLHIGMSIGAAIFPADGADATSLLANCDAALYRAKHEGRGRARFFEPDMDRRLREHRALQHDLKTAMERGELAMHYQPQARIGGEIIGFEALIRWNHPTRGLVPPAAFIPVAEEGGLIIGIGEWVLREVCREAASWPRPLQISANLSPVQFQHGDLPSLVHSILLETGLAASRLELEITENALIGDQPRALSILRRLKALGVRIAMDDFGTGYSSLSYLQSFPFDKIKIDRSFVARAEAHPQSAAIIRAVIGLGRGLDLPIVAEGVESEEQLSFLTRESCDEVQGYLIGRPAPIADYAELIGRAAPPRRPAQPRAKSGP